jgi:hypothetical protein
VMLGLKSQGKFAPMTDAEWLAVVTRHRNTYVLVENGRVVDEGPHLQMAGAFSQAVAEGRTISLMSRFDHLKVRVVESVLES